MTLIRPIDREIRTEVPFLRVLLCPDQPGWAYDNIANSIARHADGNWTTKLYMRHTFGSEHVFFQKILTNRIDVCHVFWREDLFYMLHPDTVRRAAAQLGLGVEVLSRALGSCAFTTSVYDHLFISPEEMLKRRNGFVRVDGYTVSSQRLLAAYAAEPDLPAPDVVITDGVDTERFHPAPHIRTDPVPTVGWVGNSAWGRNCQDEDIKGYHRIFQPMMQELSRRGIKVAPNVADRETRFISFDDMPDFYRATDIFVCTSLMEGTPNPVLEAMASGIPVVSSDVGIVPEAFGARQKRFIVKEQTPQAYADAVAELIRDPQLRRELGEENRARAREWSWEIKARQWWPFWSGVAARLADPRTAMRRELTLCLPAG